jgi:hypothetical protein
VWLAILSGCTEDPAATPDEPADVERPPTSVEEIVAQRSQLDTTVFSDEVQAQTYERAFVRLWDQLLAGDAFTVLKAFPFDTFLLGKFDSPERQDWGVGEMKFYRTMEPSESLSHDQYVRRLDALEFDDWNIVQTEWHHSRFEPATDGHAARSVVSAELHVAHDRRDHRFIIRAKLKVQWSGRRDSEGVPIAAVIDATQVEVIEREGRPMFEEILTVDPTRVPPARIPRISPLLLHDLDGDGLSEIVLAGCNLVYWNRGDGQFEHGEFLSHGFPELANAGILADFDGDGWVDFLGVAKTDNHLRFFSGSSGGRFTTPSRKCFSEKLVEPQTMTAGDVDGDGDLDLFIGQWKPPYVKGTMPTPFYDALDGPPDYLLENDGSGNFTDVTQRANLAAKRTRRTYSASLVDLDDDGDLDLIAVCDFAGLDLYRNDGAGRFSDVTGDWVDERHAFGMSHATGDFDGDGRLDLYMVGMSSTTARRLDQLGLNRPGFEQHAKYRMPMAYGNRMLLGRDGRFLAADNQDQVARTGWSWGCTATDFDNDGDLDLYVANGHLSGKSTKDYCTRYWCHDIYAGGSQPDKTLSEFFSTKLYPALGHEVSWNGYEHNVLFLNRKGGEFLNAAFLLGAAFEFDSRAVASDDLDGDGRRDLLVVEYDASAFRQYLHVLANRSESEGNWIGVRLIPRRGGPSPMGAKVIARSGSRRWIHHVVSGDSFSTQHAFVAHFGLGSVKQVDSVEIYWPGGRVSRLKRPATGTYHRVQSPRATPK